MRSSRVLAKGDRHRTAGAYTVRALAAFLLVGAVSTLVPRPVWGAGIEAPDVGAVATGRGGANAARPLDGLAFQYNPAGLAW